MHPVWSDVSDVDQHHHGDEAVTHEERLKELAQWKGFQPEYLAACLAGAEALRLLRAWVEDGTPWDQYNECTFCGERWQNPRKHGKDCAWAAANALLATEVTR
jgi:hypothetical protein